MTPVSTAARPCFICGRVIALGDFLPRPESGADRFAICGYCGAPNEEQDTAFLVVAEDQPAALPAPVIGIAALPGGGWRASCDCGLTEAACTQALAWAWVLDHHCMTPLNRPI